MLWIALKVVAGPLEAVNGPALIGNRKTETTPRRHIAERTNIQWVPRGMYSLAFCASVIKERHSCFTMRIFEDELPRESVCGSTFPRERRLAKVHGVEIGHKGG